MLNTIYDRIIIDDGLKYLLQKVSIADSITEVKSVNNLLLVVNDLKFEILKHV